MNTPATTSQPRKIGESVAGVDGGEVVAMTERYDRRSPTSKSVGRAGPDRRVPERANVTCEMIEHRVTPRDRTLTRTEGLTMPEVMVRVLGPVEIERNGHFVATRSTSRRRMIAVLAVHRREEVALDRLTDLMQASPAAVRTIVSRVRHDLDADIVKTTATGYCIDAHRCDATQVEHLLAKARTDAGERALGLIEEALSYWRGRSFGEFADQAWAEAEAARLDEIEQLAHEDHADLLIDVGRHDEAIAELRPHIAGQPLRDRPRRSLMVALHRAGRTTEALREFQAYRTFLANEIGVGPSPATIAVERMIARDDRATVWPEQQRRIAEGLTSDLDRIGLALAQLLLHEGRAELAARALGTCHCTWGLDGQTDSTLEEISELLGRHRVQQLLAAGRRCSRSVLYGELWAAVQPLLEPSSATSPTEPGAHSSSE